MVTTHTIKNMTVKKRHRPRKIASERERERDSEEPYKNVEYGDSYCHILCTP